MGYSCSGHARIPVDGLVFHWLEECPGISGPVLDQDYDSVCNSAEQISIAQTGVLVNPLPQWGFELAQQLRIAEAMAHVFLSGRPRRTSRTMPAATVACDTGSIRMKLPVVRWAA